MCKYAFKQSSKNNQYIALRMFDWLRKIVAGPKNRTISEQYDLDLTYITQNIIAMAYPATGFEKLYRNCLEDVVAFLESKHKGKYYIINVSNREYDNTPFEGRVKSYDWNDHQAPCLTTLFEISEFTAKFIKENPNGVVVFHCNHGKGRTGTGIMSSLMYIQDFQSSNEVLLFYNQKRFSTNKYVVDQPCQKRYLDFFDEILKHPENYQAIKAYKLIGVKHEGLGPSFYLNITQVRDNKLIYEKINFQAVQPEKSSFLMGDIFIQLFKKGVFIDSRICRANYNLQFANKLQNSWKIQLKGENLAIDKCQSPQFSVILQFQLYCRCHQKEEWKAQCLCFKYRQKQQWHWSKMHQVINNKNLKESFKFNNLNSDQQLNI